MCEVAVDSCRVYDYLQTIPPTSVEAERAFSAAGPLCTKICSRLSDATRDMYKVLPSQLLSQLSASVSIQRVATAIKLNVQHVVLTLTV